MPSSLPFPAGEAKPPARGALRPDQPHPLVFDARRFLMETFAAHPMLMSTMQGAMASSAIENNAIAEVCGETLRRMMAGEEVGERFVWGLAWFVRQHFDLVSQHIDEAAPPGS